MKVYFFTLYVMDGIFYFLYASKIVNFITFPSSKLSRDRYKPYTNQLL
jgi:hypothetical protein